MVCNHLPAYRAWQLQFKRFKQRGELGLLSLKQSAHVLPVFPRLVNNGHRPSSLARHFTCRPGGRRHEVSGCRGDGPPPRVLLITHDRASGWLRLHGRRPALLPASGNAGIAASLLGRRALAVMPDRQRRAMLSESRIGPITGSVEEQAPRPSETRPHRQQAGGRHGARRLAGGGFRLRPGSIPHGDGDHTSPIQLAGLGRARDQKAPC